MPARRFRASFNAIPPHLDFKQLVADNENFEYVSRIKYDAIEKNGIEKFHKLILTHVIQNGKPLVIDGFEECFDPNLFSTNWLRDNHGDEREPMSSITRIHNLIN